eukprot:gene14217-biopygen21623
MCCTVGHEKVQAGQPRAGRVQSRPSVAETTLFHRPCVFFLFTPQRTGLNRLGPAFQRCIRMARMAITHRNSTACTLMGAGVSRPAGDRGQVEPTGCGLPASHVGSMASQPWHFSNTVSISVVFSYFEWGDSQACLPPGRWHLL